jgi:uncharacterized membrane protein YsdA (DUF1294 family)
MRPVPLYASLSAALLLTLLLALQLGLEWPLYASWLGAAGLTTFALYGLDKRMARAGRKPRVPERVLNLLTMAGGFVGAWAGRALFHHKTNSRQHSGMHAVLIAGTLVHSALICLVLYWQS